MECKFACRLVGLFAVLNMASAGWKADAGDFDNTTETVGPHRNGFAETKFVTPVNQILTPAGLQIDLPAIRPNALALSPDHRLLVTAGRGNQLIVIGAQTGKIFQEVRFPSDTVPGATPVSTAILGASDQARISFNGLTFSPDGTRIYLSNVKGDVKVFGVNEHGFVSPLFAIALPAASAPNRPADLPAGIAVSADGKHIYVALNLSNRLVEMEAVTGKILRQWEVGVAPYDVVVAGDKIYVSNWGGRRPGASDLTGPAGLETRVRVDPVCSVASEGSVSVVHLDGTATSEIVTGRHACALALARDGKSIVVANAGSDTLSVIDTRTDKIVETICARQNPGDPFGAQPNALAFDKSGAHLFVCNGTQNAVAEIQFDPGNSKLLGLIPTGWFPSGIVFDGSRKQIYVTNMRGLTRGTSPFSVGNYYNTLSLIDVPSTRKLASLTQTALANLRYPLLAQARLPARDHQPAQPVPERVGEPSVFQHVIYIIKENHTYDQILGDVKAGDGDASLCNFGQRVTPNSHQLVHDFVLLDNAYCCGMVSADGHQWADSALATDYVERSATCDWPRSYPFRGDDALALSPAGSIWDDALAHGQTVRDFGEFTGSRKRWKTPGRTGPLDFLASYHDYVSGSNAIAYGCEPCLASLRPYVATNIASWDLDVPDVVRAAEFIKELKQAEQTGTFAGLNILYLPNDHTSGTRFGSPTPEAQIADNDLALGQVVAAVSHSSFWRNTCILAVEDDPQAGADHISGYRTTVYVASAYTRRGVTISTQYNQTSLLRTMELMLGIPPMNQMDATATPMFDCFTNTPDLTPWNAVPNIVPLDEMNPDPKKITNAQLRKDAYVSARLPLEKPDQCPDDVLNHILWRATMGGQPYPEWAVRKLADD